jgi:hypothetical protein
VSEQEDLKKKAFAQNNCLVKGVIAAKKTQRERTTADDRRGKTSTKE